MSNLPAVSVIVPFFNSQRHIGDCLESLRHQDVRAPYEVIFVDNGSTDGSAAIVSAYPEVTVLDESTPGAYAARNAGIERATAPLLAFTDADCQVAPDWIRSIQEGMTPSDVAVLVGPCQYPDRASWVLRVIEAYENAKTEYVITQCSPARHFAYANNMAVRASVFDELGSFKEWTRAADSELVHRLAARRPDLRLVYRPSMLVTHQEFTSARRRLARLSLYTQTNAQIDTFQELDLGTRLQIVWRMLRRLQSG